MITEFIKMIKAREASPFLCFKPIEIIKFLARLFLGTIFGVWYFYHTTWGPLMVPPGTIFSKNAYPPPYP